MPAKKPCNTPECRRMKALLSEFLDHTLHWRTARSLEAHLERCPPCRGFVRTVEKTIVLVQARPLVDVPVEVRDHLRTLMREKHARSPRARAGKTCR